APCTRTRVAASLAAWRQSGPQSSRRRYGFQTASGAGLLVKTSHSLENIEEGIEPAGNSPLLPLPLGPMRLEATLNTGFFHSSTILASLAVIYPWSPFPRRPAFLAKSTACSHSNMSVCAFCRQQWGALF